VSRGGDDRGSKKNDLFYSNKLVIEATLTRRLSSTGSGFTCSIRGGSRGAGLLACGSIVSCRFWRRRCLASHCLRGGGSSVIIGSRSRRAALLACGSVISCRFWRRRSLANYCLRRGRSSIIVGRRSRGTSLLARTTLLPSTIIVCWCGRGLSRRGGITVAFYGRSCLTWAFAAANLSALRNISTNKSWCWSRSCIRLTPAVYVSLLRRNTWSWCRCWSWTYLRLNT
jgi:hypothetical protein